ncbi:MAG: glycosyltransferase family 4 protein [Methanobacteriota archaeon]|nr:MAG: glycosyltransferase family 4 protein [Euryarchaeota archaeon]
MKISVLTPDVSHNCLGRAYMLARILQRRFDVEIIGPMFGEGVWAPLADAREVPLKTLRVRGSWTNAKAVALRDQLEGDVLYASKPRFPSYGLGLIEKLARRSSVVLDIDDWEGGFVRAARSERMERRPLRALLSDAVYNTTIALAEGLPRLADELTVSNTFLQKRFGGVLIWHGRDTEAFRPDRFSRSAVRAAHGIPDQEKVVMFLGSPGPHKGVEDLMEAVRRIPDPSVSLALVGIPDGTGYGARLRAEGLSLLGPRFRGMGFLPFDKVPELLTLADVVVIPQRRTQATEGQMPAKVFDAMAMGKPIIASAVADLPYVLRDCGKVVEPGSVENLSTAIQSFLSDPGAAAEFGRRARERCVQEFSWDALEPVLVGVFKAYA